jgi:hypothetical protein
MPTSLGASEKFAHQSLPGLALVRLAADAEARGQMAAAARFIAMAYASFDHSLGCLPEGDHGPLVALPLWP